MYKHSFKKEKMASEADEGAPLRLEVRVNSLRFARLESALFHSCAYLVGLNLLLRLASRSTHRDGHESFSYIAAVIPRLHDCIVRSR